LPDKYQEQSAVANTSKRRTSHVATIAGAAALMVIALGPLLDATPAAAADSKSTYDWNQSSYIQTMRAGAVETYAFLPREESQDFGYSLVDLTHDTGAPSGKCSTEGGGYWLGEILEKAVLSYGAAPPDENGKVNAGYQNPVLARSVNPDLTPDQHGNTTPTLSSPSGPSGTAACETDAAGEGTGFILKPVPGIEFAGSTTRGEVDKKTGLYTGTGRSYLQAVTASGDLATISSLMQVKSAPGAEPLITYRLSFVESGSDGSTSNAEQNGFTLEGKDVPASDLVAQFNDQAKAGSVALSALGPAGLQLLAPSVARSADGGRMGLTGPVIEGHLGLAAREGTIGYDQGLRFGAVTFTGVYA
jgi:hypothetical protein